MLVMEAFGHVMALEPYLATVVLGGTALRLAGSEAQKSAMLPRVAEGHSTLAFAHGERQARYDLTDVLTTAKPTARGWVLDGAKSVVTHGDCADTLVVSARTSGERDDADGITLFLVDAAAGGVARRGYTMRDEQRAAEVSLSGVQVGADAVLGEVGQGLAIIERVIEAGIGATAAESVGAMDALHGMTLEYSRTREQFGKPIGTYQVVQHRLAEMLMSLEQGRSMAMLAAMMVDEPDPRERAHNIAMAKVGIGQAGRFVSQNAVQLHGGIGMTEELAVGHYFRRCMVIERLFGDTSHYLAKLAAEVE
jgi:alkylation response protein AidB-like acyl-CoA dehydrogenase